MKHGYFHGILYGSFRSFFVALTATIGVAFGVILFISILGGIAATNDEVERDYKVEIVPNAKGVRKALSKKSPVILQLNINGIIGTEQLNMDTVREQLVESREGDLKKDRVKAILLTINTPGGTVTDSDGIYRAIKAYKEQYKVPVYAYVDGLCASGGMYVASAADKVFASDVSLIGSIGVLSPSFFNVSELINTIGIKTLTISEGKGKDAMNPLRPWKPDEDKMYREIIEYYYKMFVNIVTEARPDINKEKLVDTYGAHIFPAEEAKSIGYITEANHSRNETLKLLLKEIGIDDDYYQVVQLDPNSWAAKLFSSESPIFGGTVKHKLEMPQEYDARLSGKFMYLYQ